MFVLTMAGYNLTRLRSLGQIRLQGGVRKKIKKPGRERQKPA